MNEVTPMTRQDIEAAARVMQAAADGYDIDRRPKGTHTWLQVTDVTTLPWNWDTFEYRVRPKPRQAFAEASELWIASNKRGSTTSFAVCRSLEEAERVEHTHILHVSVLQVIERNADDSQSDERGR